MVLAPSLRCPRPSSSSPKFSPTFPSSRAWQTSLLQVQYTHENLHSSSLSLFPCFLLHLGWGWGVRHELRRLQRSPHFLDFPLDIPSSLWYNIHMKNNKTYTLRNPYGTGDMITGVSQDMLSDMVKYLAWLSGVRTSSIIVVEENPSKTLTSTLA